MSAKRLALIGMLGALGAILMMLSLSHSVYAALSKL